MNSIWWWFNSISSCRISTDENLEKVEKSFYVILSAIKQEGVINKEYKRIEFTNKVLTDFILFFCKRDHFLWLIIFINLYYIYINLMIVKINIKNILAKI